MIFLSTWIFDCLRTPCYSPQHQPCDQALFKVDALFTQSMLNSMHLFTFNRIINGKPNQLFSLDSTQCPCALVKKLEKMSHVLSKRFPLLYRTPQAMNPARFKNTALHSPMVQHLNFPFSHLQKMLLGSKMNSHNSLKFCQVHQDGRWVIKVLNDI